MGVVGQMVADPPLVVHRHVKTSGDVLDRPGMTGIQLLRQPLDPAQHTCEDQWNIPAEHPAAGQKPAQIEPCRRFGTVFETIPDGCRRASKCFASLSAHATLNQLRRPFGSKRLEISNHGIGQRVSEGGVRDVVRRPLRIDLARSRIVIEIGTRNPCRLLEGQISSSTQTDRSSGSGIPDV